MSQESPSKPYVIGQQEFEPLAQLWKDSLAVPSILQKSFLDSSGSILQGVGFRMKHILELVSTIGATHIKVAFIMQPDESGHLQFSVALFAVDFLTTRLSSYYVPSYVTTDETMLTEAVGGTEMRYKNQVSSPLLRDWLYNWATYGKGEASYFDSQYGPLQGYTFEISEFTAMFYRLHSQRVKDSNLELLFVLHHYWRSMPLEAPTHEAQVYTFGLVIRLKRPSLVLPGTGHGEDDGTGHGPGDGTGMGGGTEVGTGDDAVLDMGKPSPPY